jgi:flagellar assembly protein FliH
VGRIVRGVRVDGEAYQIKPPPLAEPVQAQPATAFDDRPIFAQVRDFTLDPEPEPAPPALDDLRAQAQRIVDEATVDAQQIVSQARADAMQIVEEAERNANRLEAEAKQRGYDDGMNDGRAAAQAEMDEMMATMRGLIEMARAERHKIIESAEPELVRLSVAIAERVLHAHVAVEPGAVLEIVRSAISRIVDRETITVRVNPADLELMREHRDQLMAMNDVDNMRLIEDQRVDRGGVVVETEAGTVDAKLTTQLREVRRLMAVPPPAQAS